MNTFLVWIFKGLIGLQSVRKFGKHFRNADFLFPISKQQLMSHEIADKIDELEKVTLVFFLFVTLTGIPETFSRWTLSFRKICVGQKNDKNMKVVTKWAKTTFNWFPVSVLFAILSKVLAIKFSFWSKNIKIKYKSIN